MTDHLPERPGASHSTDIWTGFSADPRNPSNANYRASDADRANAGTMLAEGYADGRLTHEEYDQRLDQLSGVRRLGEFVPLLDDLALPGAGGVRAAGVGEGEDVDDADEGHPISKLSLNGWIGLTILFNLIWLATVIGTRQFQYYWPFWPMLGTAIPAIMGMGAGRALHRRDQRERRQLERQFRGR